MLQVNDYTVSLNGIKGVSKSSGIWASVKGQSMTIPLMFLKKPKWMAEKDFNMLVKSIQIYIPPNYNFEGDL